MVGLGCGGSASAVADRCRGRVRDDLLGQAAASRGELALRRRHPATRRPASRSVGRDRRLAGRRVPSRRRLARRIPPAPRLRVGVAGGPWNRSSGGYAATHDRTKRLAEIASGRGASVDAHPTEHSDPSEPRALGGRRHCGPTPQPDADPGCGAEHADLHRAAINFFWRVATVDIVRYSQLARRLQQRHLERRGIHARWPMTANPPIHRKAARTR